MTRKCIIPGCDAKSLTGLKFHSFSVSTKDDVRLSWQNAINTSYPPRALLLKPKQLICEKHFAEGDIISQRELRGVDGSILGTVRGCYSYAQ